MRYIYGHWHIVEEGIEVTTGREAFEAKLLAMKYGVPGKVAGLYRSAGYQVDMVLSDDLDFIARRKGEGLGVKVFQKPGQPPEELLDKLSAAAKERGLKPILVLYGAGPRISSELREKAKGLGISVRRVRG